MSRILVTGATGFIGRAVIAAFAAQGHGLRAATRRPPPGPFPDRVEIFRHGDLAQEFDWAPALDGVEQVLHLAGIAHSSGIASERYDLVNRRATERLANAAARAGIKQFVFVSSIRAQSGPSTGHVLTESDQPAPTDDYGRSKLAAEQAVRASGVPFTILRPTVLYGPGVKGNVALLKRIAHWHLPLPLGSFTNRRSFLGIDNFISALGFVLSSPGAIGETYLVADPGMPLRLSDLIAVMRQAMHRRPLLWPMPPSVVEAPLRLIGRSALWERFGGDMQVDAGKLIAAGWRPAHDTTAGLAAMAAATTRRE